MPFSRRRWIRTVPALGAFAVSPRAAAADAAGDYTWPAAPPAAGEPLDDAYPSHHPFPVKEIVGVSHGNLARVKELVSRHPALAKASWDWGFGDWESALGAASHVGNRPEFRSSEEFGSSGTGLQFTPGQPESALPPSQTESAPPPASGARNASDGSPKPPQQRRRTSPRGLA